MVNLARRVLGVVGILFWLVACDSGRTASETTNPASPAPARASSPTQAPSPTPVEVMASAQCSQQLLTVPQAALEVGEEALHLFDTFSIAVPVRFQPANPPPAGILFEGKDPTLPWTFIDVSIVHHTGAAPAIDKFAAGQATYINGLGRSLISAAAGSPGQVSAGAAVRIAWCGPNDQVKQNGQSVPYAGVEWVVPRSTSEGWDGYAIQISTAIVTWKTNGPVFERVANSLAFTSH